MTTIAGSHRSVESHLQGPVGASGSFAPESQPGSRALATVTMAALNRQIDHLLDQRRIKRHAIPSGTTTGIWHLPDSVGRPHRHAEPEQQPMRLGRRKGEKDHAQPACRAQPVPGRAAHHRSARAGRPGPTGKWRSPAAPPPMGSPWLMAAGAVARPPRRPAAPSSQLTDARIIPPRWGCRAHPAAPSPCRRRVERIRCGWRLVTSVVPLSVEAQLQRITWPSTFAHHQGRQRSAWR